MIKEPPEGLTHAERALWYANLSVKYTRRALVWNMISLAFAVLAIVILIVIHL